MHRLRFWGLLGIAVVLGLGIAWIDSRPTWDDTGITVGLLIMVSALLGFILPARAWLWALAVGIWIPAYGILSHHDFGMIVVLVFPLVGAFAGALARKALGALRISSS